MKKWIDIRPFREGDYTLQLLGLTRVMPLFAVKKELWIAGNEHLSFGCDVAFTKKIVKRLVAGLKGFDSHCLLTAEAKATALAYGVAAGLGQKEYAIARKELKEDIKGYLSVSTRSITAKNHGTLVLSKRHAKMIANKNIILIDDVISTGQTMQGLMRLARSAHARVVAMASIWLEGPWPFDMFRDRIKSKRLVYLDVLPLFAKGNTYKKLVAYKKKVERITKCP